ncbi:MAG: hypothetical protein QF787_08140 [Nitrospinota bacterium]|jgi:uncharacterized membrane protein|nr:hypothetical protein [Nitrospinota bacterium]MDP6366104.1 hypothetical protein [Nitrospinota bacterium]MDP7370521.1 hypothetical protein [Nitrospinota bacterium]MDP7503620.1 hypothetical protein [Nitrospinota bacterium]MDP7665009.1 hypothetical protein [Nitrospinota bacterium]
MNYSIGNIFVTTVHVISAILAVGGVAFFRFAALPYAESLPEDQKQNCMQALRARFVPILHGSFAMLILTGIHHITRLIRTGVGIPDLLIVKIVLALIIVFIGVALTMKTGFEAMKAKRETYLTLNLILAAVVVLLGIWITHG